MHEKMFLQDVNEHRGESDLSGVTYRVWYNADGTVEAKLGPEASQSPTIQFKTFRRFVRWARNLYKGR